VKRRSIPGAPAWGVSSGIILGVAGVLSLVWLGTVNAYVTSGPGWTNLVSSHPTDFAVFLAAVGVPVGVLWLAAGALMLARGQRQVQGALLRAQGQAQRTTGEIEALVRTSIEMQELARRQSFLNGADLALKDLNSQAGMIISRLGLLDADATEYLWAMNAAGDPWAFCHALVERSAVPGFVDDLAGQVIGDEVALGAMHRFLRRYERLLALAKEYDADKLLRDVLEDGPLDRVYAVFRAVAGIVQVRLVPTPDWSAEGTEAPPYAGDGAVPWDDEPRFHDPVQEGFPAEGPAGTADRPMDDPPFRYADEVAESLPLVAIQEELRQGGYADEYEGGYDDRPPQVEAADDPPPEPPHEPLDEGASWLPPRDALAHETPAEADGAPKDDSHGAMRRLADEIRARLAECDEERPRDETGSRR